MDTAHVYAEITKAERQDDGTLLVRGVATSPALDIDEQVCDPTWLSKAMPTWFGTGGNIREQHSQIAAGVAEEYTEKDGGAHEIVARVVDPVSVKKVERKVLKGFSIGIRGPRVITDKAAPGGRIVDGQIVEVSLVDRPANPDCVLTLAKSAKPGMEVRGSEFDSATGLVRVEELTEKTVEPDPVDKTADTDAGAATDSGGVPDLAAADPGDGVAPTGVVESTATTPVVEPDAAKAADPAEVVDLAALATRVALLLKTDVVEIVKRDFSDKKRQQMASEGAAMPGGGYPIETVGDLKNAIRAIGRAKDPAAAKAHIIRRARALGREDLIPEQWRSGGKAADSEVMAHDPAVLQTVRNGLLSLIIAEAQEAMRGEDETADISLLNETLAYFLAWWDHEAREGEAPLSAETKAAAPTSTATPGACVCPCDHCASCVGLANPAMDGVPADQLPRAETPKAADPDPVPAAEAAPTTPADEADKTAAPDTVKAAVAEATAELKNELAAALARLEQVEKQAAPGGPVRVRTLAQETHSREADELRTKAARLKATARTVSDPEIRAEYDRQATLAETQLRALTTT